MNLRIIKGLRGRIYSSEIFARRQHPAVCSDVIRLSNENMFDVIKSPLAKAGVYTVAMSFCSSVCLYDRLFVCLSPMKFLKSFATWQHLAPSPTHLFVSHGLQCFDYFF